MRKLLFLIFFLSGIISANAWSPQGDKIMTRWGKVVSPKNAWQEYPRPQLRREAWANLNGLWQYAITDKDATQPGVFDGEILVPFAAESALSGVGRSVSPDQKLWYQTKFTISPQWKGKNIMLHFDAVDWHSTVWLNGKKVGEHKGGFDPFSFDVTKYLKAKGEQTLVIAVLDPTCSDSQARGKQQLNQEGIWYTPVTGIWQTVWMEPTSAASIENIIPATNIRTKTVVINTKFRGIKGGEKVTVNVYDNGKTIKSAEFVPTDKFEISLPQTKLWTPSEPKLYHFDIILSKAGKELDKVASYFAFREVSMIKDVFGRSRMALNGNILFQYGTLDQGWWPDGLLTPPSAEAMCWDMQILKQMGFNTIRKHIKVEPSIYYYYADSIGLMLWQDMPSGFAVSERKFSHVKSDAPKDWCRSAESSSQWESELKAMIDHLRFFPSIVTWVVFNEGWGQYETQKIVNWTKNYDRTRLINGVSGWTDRKVGDMFDIHNYPVTAMSPMNTIQNRIHVLGEFGGLGMPVKDHIWNANMRNWGYKNFDESKVLLNDYAKLMFDLKPLISAGLSGAIYTQTTDVEGEVNGLITYDREIIKFPIQMMHIIHSDLYSTQPQKELCLIADSRVASCSKNIAVGKKISDKDVVYESVTMPGVFKAAKVVSAKETFTLDKMPTQLSIFMKMSEKAKVWLNGHLIMDNVELRLSRSYNHFNLSDYVEYLRIGENIIEVENVCSKPNVIFDYALYAF